MHEAVGTVAFGMTVLLVFLAVRPRPATIDSRLVVRARISWRCAAAWWPRR